MPQFQIRKHPHSGTWQTFYLNSGKPTKSWYEANSVQDCVDYILNYADQNIHTFWHVKFLLEVLPD